MAFAAAQGQASTRRWRAAAGRCCPPHEAGHPALVVRARPPARLLTRALLRPASWVWAAVTARRHRPRRPFDPGVPVICVGNLTLGGSGKTPVVRERARSSRGARTLPPTC